MQRRNFVIGSTALALARPSLAQPLIRYTASTAPDRLTKQILTSALSRLDSGPYDRITNLRNNWPQIIEQNFARLNGTRVATLLDSMTSAELSMLAQVYTGAAAPSGRSRLYDLLAVRLGGAHLGKVSRAFGFAPLYDAIHRVAPEKSQKFLENSSTSFLAPMHDISSLQGTRLMPARFLNVQRAPNPNIEMTILQIYLDYRTAPVGSLGPLSAAYQTTTYSLGHLATAFGFGVTIGTGVSYLLQNYAPSVHNWIGEQLYNFFTPIFNIFQSGTQIEIGTAQMSMAFDFGLSALAPIFAETGGDYGVVSAWSAMAGGGGCGGDPEGCPILL